MTVLKNALLIGILGVSPFAKAQGGNWVGNGGDGLATELFLRIQTLSQNMTKLIPECAERSTLKATRFAEIVSHLKVETSVNPLYLLENGRWVYHEGINYPEHGVIVFHRAAIQSSPKPDPLLLHEVFKLALLEDDRGVQSHQLAEMLEDPACQRSPAVEPSALEMKPPLGEIPVALRMDKQGTLYFTAGARAQIYRYSMASNQYLAPLKIREIPKTLAVAEDLNRLYLGYSRKEITYIDLRSPTVERPFVKVQFQPMQYWSLSDLANYDQSELRTLIPIGQTLVVDTDAFGSWKTMVTYDTQAKFQSQLTWIPNFVDYVVSPNQDGFYVLSGFSGGGLEFISTQGHGFIDSARAPSHREFEVVGLRGKGLAISPTQMAFGSGLVLNLITGRPVAESYAKWDKAVWVGSVLYGAQFQAQGFSLFRRASPALTEEPIKSWPSGTLLSLLSWRGHLYVAWVNDEGEFRVDLER